MIKASDDRRSKRTKKMIRSAFSQLIEEKGFNDISITDIAVKADINRGTFYLHYNDKYDLLKKIEDEIIQELICNCRTISKFALKDAASVNKPMPFMIKLFEYLKENAVFMNAILGCNGDPIFARKLKEIIKTCLFEDNSVLIQENMLVPESYLIAYVLSAHLGVIQQWLENGMEKSPEEMAMILSNMFLLGPFKSAGLANTTAQSSG
ncbi:TetR family transcriptional regulator [Ruminiclostridium sufflavum DSM 19573]|uniref:TetR family transcriptional regulator n=1 Tax=Ruminiclostridium sufflavum DSM 19573 TaxID=1121337 RepID=A0A318XIH1_9FIRM|nr:TetR/AcrR family transcriptional regulator [Ruminiclostridium sufflavum]PYG85613.1 TetR family transcriptional regulator [Ruminiclostridium sufflavum DSM 19573]